MQHHLPFSILLFKYIGGNCPAAIQKGPTLCAKSALHAYPAGQQAQNNADQAAEINETNCQAVCPVTPALGVFCIHDLYTGHISSVLSCMHAQVF